MGVERRLPPRVFGYRAGDETGALELEGKGAIYITFI